MVAKTISKAVADMLGLAPPKKNELIACEEDIRFAYRLLLDREPDSSGRQHFLEAIKSGRLSPGEIVDMIIRSDEYRVRNVENAQLIKVETPGGIVFVRAGDRLIGGTLRTGKPYEPYVITMFEQEVREGDCVLDVGANVGIFTMLAAKLVGSAGRVLAIEPLSQNVQCLCKGVTYNKYSQVEIFPLAASDRVGIVPMICAANSSNGIVDAYLNSDYVENFVPTQRLDSLLCTLPRLDIIKIDVEGHEPAVWKGLEGLLFRHKPRIFMEFSPAAIQNHSRIDAVDLMKEIFHFSEKVTVLHRTGSPVDCTDVDAVMTEWKEVNHQAGLQGELHLDLLVWPKR